jgi:hypothetical protein
MSETVNTASPDLPSTMTATERPHSRFDMLLIYDVRRVTYDFMESELPPMSNTYMGFAMCCTAAHEEIRQALGKARNQFARAVEAEFVDKTTFECQIPRVLKSTP